MEKVRIGVVGCGGMGQKHIEYIKELPMAELVAVSDVDTKTVDSVCQQFGAKGYNDYNQMINSGTIDAILIATPHYFHPAVGIAAFKKGLHVLCEKPITVAVSAADKFIAAARKSKKVFGVMYQLRTLPAIRVAREIVNSGKLGEIRRTILVEPNYRSQAYYDSATWRGTWKGEGGGVLMNQAPHSIDLFMILGGLPCKVTARTRTDLHKGKVEVEDQADALLEYKNGAWGYFYTTTCEFGGEARLEIIGEKGMLIYSNGRDLRFISFVPSIPEHNKTNKEMWSAPQAVEEKIELPQGETGHKEIIRNFCETILGREKLIAPGEQGLLSVEFINAMILSGRTGKPAAIPVDRKKYDVLLEKLKKTSKDKSLKQVKRQSDPNIK